MMLSPVPVAAVRRVVDLARLAPSLHNTQPWHWRMREGALELWADRTRSLPVADPDGRELLISCGNALHHTVVAARAFGLEPNVSRFPDPTRADLLAVIELGRGVVPEDAGEEITALRERCTDRRRFTSWPVPDERLRKLARHAADLGVAAIPVTDISLRFRMELLVEEVRRRQSADPRYAEETARWIERSNEDGVPVAALPQLTGRVGERVHRFEGGAAAAPPPRILDSSDGLVVLATDTDGPMDRLRSGEALSALWLEATREGLSVVPLSQLVEDANARTELRHELGGAHPQIMARIGWQEISRSTLPRTPRRPLDDVLTT